MTIAKSIMLFVLAAVAEIGGAWLVWQAVREGRAWWCAGLGVIALGICGPDPGRLRWRIRRRVPGLGHGLRRLQARPLGRPGVGNLPARRRGHHVRPAQHRVRAAAAPHSVG